MDGTVVDVHEENAAKEAAEKKQEAQEKKTTPVRRRLNTDQRVSFMGQ